METSGIKPWSFYTSQGGQIVQVTPVKKGRHTVSYEVEPFRIQNGSKEKRVEQPVVEQN